jgi:serine/threonine protein kinase
VYPVFLCDEHRKFFEESLQEENKMELTESSITLNKKLGNGAFGSVFKGLLFNITVAVKIIEMKTGILDSTVDKNLLKSTMNEVEILRKLDHPNIGSKHFY